MSQLLEDALSRDGVAVTRAACPEAAGAACAACLAAGLDGLERKLALPQTMAERMRGASALRPICTTVSAAVAEFARREFRVLTVLRRGAARHWPARPAPSSWRRSAGMRSCASSR